MARNARMIGGRRFIEVSRFNSKRDASARAKRLRDQGNTARVTKESDGKWAVWDGPKRGT